MTAPGFLGNTEALMAEPYLKYRTRFTSSLKNELVPLFDALSRTTRVPKSRLLDEAIEDLLKKYGAPLPEERHGTEKPQL